MQGGGTATNQKAWTAASARVLKPSMPLEITGWKNRSNQPLDVTPWPLWDARRSPGASLIRTPVGTRSKPQKEWKLFIMFNEKKIKLILNLPCISLPFSRPPRLGSRGPSPQKTVHAQRRQRLRIALWNKELGAPSQIFSMPLDSYRTKHQEREKLEQLG